MRREWKARDLADHFFYLGAVHPDLATPLRSRWSGLTDEEIAGFALRLCDWLPLLQGADDEDADRLATSLDACPNGPHLEMLTAVGTPYADERLAALVRKHGLIPQMETLGIEVPEVKGPVRRRFGSQWWAVRKIPVQAEPDTLRHMAHPIGLALRDIASEGDDTIQWHYVSIDLSEVEELRSLPFDRLHLVGPKDVCAWSLFCGVEADERYQCLLLENHQHPGEEDDDEDLLDGVDNDTGGDFGRAQLLPADDGLTYCNGHVLLTEGVVGTIGGPPISLYPNPKCHACGRLMFHLLTVDASVREHGDGFRSLFLCEDCRLVCCSATSYN